MTTKRQIILKLLVVLLVALSTIGWWQRQDIGDWLRLRNYEPAVEIAELADRTDMTDHARRLFYVYHPKLNDREDFNTNCTDSEHSIVLGCYVSRTGIYIYDVDDPRLNGIKEVTAAHEMLHVAYERLSASEREWIDARVMTEFKNVTSERITKAVAAYREKDSSIVPNELHSILGTEVRTLSRELEDYYGRYFNDRLAVVGFSENYERAFAERQERVARYDAELEALRAQIDLLQSSLNSQSESLHKQRDELNSLLSNNQIEQYNAGVPVYNANVQSYNISVNEARALIDRFNRLVLERNAIALEGNELIKAIDSRPVTIPTQ
jgi:hypothetical protein